MGEPVPFVFPVVDLDRIRTRLADLVAAREKLDEQRQKAGRRASDVPFLVGEWTPLGFTTWAVDCAVASRARGQIDPPDLALVAIAIAHPDRTPQGRYREVSGRAVIVPNTSRERRALALGALVGVLLGALLGAVVGWAGQRSAVGDLWYAVSALLVVVGAVFGALIGLSIARQRHTRRGWGVEFREFRRWVRKSRFGGPALRAQMVPTPLLAAVGAVTNAAMAVEVLDEPPVALVDGEKSAHWLVYDLMKADSFDQIDHFEQRCIDLHDVAAALRDGAEVVQEQQVVYREVVGPAPTTARRSRWRRMRPAPRYVDLELSSQLAEKIRFQHAAQRDIDDLTGRWSRDDHSD